MRHPCEFFIKYLVTLPCQESQDNSWVRLGIQTLGFPTPADTYIDDLRQRLYVDLPVNYVPNDRYNRPSMSFLRAAGIWSLHNPDKAVHEATAILVDFRSRRLVERLLLGRLSPKDVAKKVNARLETFFTTEVISTYHHYYWNTSLLKADDWVTFFDEYEKSEASKSLSVLRGGPAMALHITGFHQHVESKEILRTMQEGMFFDFLDWQQQPRSVERTRCMTQLSKAVSQVDVRLSESDSALRESLKAFEQFRMEHAQNTVKGIDDLSPAGTFTDSGARMKELGPAPEDKH